MFQATYIGGDLNADGQTLGCHVPFSSSSVNVSTIGSSNVLSASNGNITYFMASSFPTTEGITEGAVRFVYRRDGGSVFTLDIRDSFDRGDLAIVDGPDRWTLFNLPASLRMLVTNAGGSRVFDADFGATGMINGSTYEVEVNWKEGVDACLWCYVNGVRTSNILTGSWVSGTDASGMKLGELMNNTAGMTGIIDNIRIFSTVQHTASTYSPDF
jgi:hypothetical protein